MILFLKTDKLFGNIEIINLFFLLTGSLLDGEATALFIGVYLVKKGRLTWNTKLNRFFLLADWLCGICIGLNYFQFQSMFYKTILIVCIILLVGTHFKRTMEYLLKTENIFCGNKALFVVNNVKLVCLFGALFLVLPF